MNKIIFSKHSNERDRRFCIRTDIWLDSGGRRWVEKHPAYPEAKSYISEIARHQEELAKLLHGSKISVNECEKTKEGLCFAYLKGQTLEESLDQMLDLGNLDEIFLTMQQYFSEFEKIPQVEFIQTPEFAKVFGEGFHFNETRAFAVADIDMIFSNVIIQENNWCLIDYEWTFDFPVPVKYIIYRCLHYYIRGNAKRLTLERENLYQKFGILAKEEEMFARMEDAFQNYILGERTPIRLLYDDISPGCVNMNPVIDKIFAEHDQRIVQVFYDTGNGFREDESSKHQVQAGPSRIQFQIPAGIRSIRIDPCSFSCIFALKCLRCEQEDLDFSSNGIGIEKNLVLFETKDPQLVISRLPDGATQIIMEFQVSTLAGVTHQAIRSLKNQLSDSKEQISRMRATKVWRLKEKCWNLLGRR